MPLILEAAQAMAQQQQPGQQEPVQILPLDVHELFLPILACLPAAYLSPRPPPALLPLLSPILRQRIQLHTSTLPAAETPSPDPHARAQAHAPNGGGEQPSWLKYLTWSQPRAERLAEVVGELQLEPHPVSGEIELFGNVADAERSGKPQFRRLDEETLQAAVSDYEHRIAVVWTWCTNDAGSIGLESSGIAKPEHGWRVSEVLTTDDFKDSASDGSRWFDSVVEAEAAATAASILAQTQPRTNSQTANSDVPNKTFTLNGTDDSLDKPNEENGGGKIDDDADDDYWAMYDRTPGRTPAATRPPQPYTSPANRTLLSPNQREKQEEETYFSRYGAEVQPALDQHDPDEETEEQRQCFPQEGTQMPSEQHGRRLVAATAAEHAASADVPVPVSAHGAGSVAVPGDSSGHSQLQIHSPIPSRPSSSTSSASAASHHSHPAFSGHTAPGGPLPPGPHSRSRSRDRASASSPQSSIAAALEAQAEASSAAELGVKTHISTEIKSLFRLANRVGMPREEFERLVSRELELLELVEGDHD